MTWALLLSGLALLVVAEGLALLWYPGWSRSVLARFAQLPLSQFRALGLIEIAFGVALLLLLRLLPLACMKAVPSQLCMVLLPGRHLQ